MAGNAGRWRIGVDVKTVWKYPIEITDEQTIAMPAGAKILTVAVQHGQPCIWALVDPDQPLVEQVIYVHGTGHPIKHPWPYVGSFQALQGAFVGHVFVGIAEEK